MRGHCEKRGNLWTVRYRDTLHAAGCHLVLASVGDNVMGQLTRTGALETIGPANVLPVEATLGTSLRAAVSRARELQGADTD